MSLRIGGLLVGLVGLWLTVTPGGLFSQLPASRTVGRDTAFNATDAAIVVINSENYIVDLNPAARELFDVPTSGVIGSPLTTILPESVDVTDFNSPESVVFAFPVRDRIVEAEITYTNSDNDRLIGGTIVFNEITEERRRQQRIQVLNRVLRHNLRNDINVASGYVDMLSNDDTAEYTHKIKNSLSGLVKMGNKARDIENVLATEPTSDAPSSLLDIAERSVESVRSEYGEIPVSVNISPEVVVWITPTVLEAALRELVENAVEHTDATTIEVMYDAHRRTLVVTDDGPGIPDHETEILDDGGETPLQHGSGLGLWLVKWSTDMFGGTIQFEADATGTSAGVKLPPDLIDSGNSTPEQSVSS